MNLSLRAIRLTGVALLGLYAAAFAAFGIIPDSVGLVVVAFAVMAGFSGWATGAKK